jgi:hypothetical protein
MPQLSGCEQQDRLGFQDQQGMRRDRVTLDDLTDDDWLILHAVSNSEKLGYPCPEDIVQRAQHLVDAGLVAPHPDFGLQVPDEVKWKAVRLGRYF